MAKGLLIMLIVFAVVAILGWGMNKLGNAPEERKRRHFKYYIIFYGIFLIGYGIYVFFTRDNADVFTIFQIILGFIFVILALFGKLEKQQRSSS